MTGAMRQLARVGLTLGALALLFYWQRTRLRELGAVLEQTNRVAVAASWAVNVMGSVVLPALLTRLTIRGGDRIELSFAELVRTNFILRFYSLVLPNGAVMALRWQRYRRGGGGSDALALVVFEKLVLFFVYVAAAAIFLALELPRLGRGAGATFAAVLALLLVWTAALAPFFVARLAGPTQALASIIGKLSPRLLQRRVQTVCDAVIAFHRLEHHRVSVIWAISIASYVLFVLSAFVLSRGMALDLSLYAIAWMRPLVFILTLMPLTIGGLGVREASYAAFMGMYGISATTALTFGLLLFGIQIIIGLIGAALDIWSRRHIPDDPALPRAS